MEDIYESAKWFLQKLAQFNTISDLHRKIQQFTIKLYELEKITYLSF
jgi:hypothetical protein